ncbi:MAG: endonuclease III [Verrucomicrobiota bacterium]
MIKPIFQKNADEMFRILKKTYPHAHCELVFSNPLELLVATILSAQCTDARVNMVTPKLFQRYPTAEAYARAESSELETLIRSTGFFRNKAKNIIACSRQIVEKHQGKVPASMGALCVLPGIGRKTANVILGNAFGLQEGVVVDTHVIRLSGRLGLSQHKNPEKIEQDLMKIVPQKDWTLAAHLLTWHGRRRCSARKPDCYHCELQKICPSFPLV